MVNANPINNEFIVDLKGFDGPLELLLSLAQKQKVDLKEISITELVDQYLFFLKTASKLKLELAAEYLMMASFLTYLKSRILLPKDFFEEEFSTSELEQDLAFKLKRLSEIKNSTEELFMNLFHIDFSQEGIVRCASKLLQFIFSGDVLLWQKAFFCTRKTMIMLAILSCVPEYVTCTAIRRH